MKKLLSIFGTIGIVASTTNLVISCTTKKVETNFENLSSITANTWDAESFGAFFIADLSTQTIGEQQVTIISNKEKLAAYIGGEFSNYNETYNKIMQEEVYAVLYYKPSISQTWKTVDLLEINSISEDIYIRLIDSSNKKSDYLKLFLNKTQDQVETVFNLESWLSSEAETIEVKMGDTDSFLKNIKLDLINNFEQVQVNDDSSWSIADQAIKNYLNYVGEYLVRIDNYVSEYSSTQPPITIKQQLKNQMNSDQEGKNNTRESLLIDWKQIDINTTPLSLNFNYSTSATQLNLDFKDN